MLNAVRAVFSGSVISRTGKRMATTGRSYEALAVSSTSPYVYHVELNRPEKLNAFNEAMWHNIGEVFDELGRNADCRAIVLSGSGKLFTAGSVLTVLLLCRVLRLQDSLIGLVSCLTQFVASLLYLLVTRSWHMYLVPIAELLHGAAMAVQKSIGSKIVAPTDMGKLSALYSLSEAVVPLVIIPLYNLVYQHTFSSFPAAFFLASAILTAPALVMFILMYVEYKQKHAKETQKENNKKQPLPAVNKSFELNESDPEVDGVVDPKNCEVHPRDSDVERGCSKTSDVTLDISHSQDLTEEEDSKHTETQETANCHKQPNSNNQVN